jgi:uncharacterized membrane protein SirB2
VAGYVDFATIKLLHISAAVLSWLMFFVRGVWMLSGSALLRQRWVRIVPHVNDSLLLAAGVWMAVITHQYPGTHGWLSVKFAGLLLYIVLGMLALRPGRSRAARAWAWVAAQAVFAGIVGVAVLHRT